MKYAVAFGLFFGAGSMAGVAIAAGSAPVSSAAGSVASAAVPGATSIAKIASKPNGKVPAAKPLATATAAPVAAAVEPAPAPPPAPVVAAQAPAAPTTVEPAPATTAASAPATTAASVPTVFKEPVFRIGFGIVGEGGIVATEKPSTGDPDKRYPGYFGPKYGGGIALEGRFFGALGLEIGLLQLTEKASADINGTKTTIEQSVIHIPMYLKGILPFGPIRPFIGFGP
jgi:hypothetical protein